MIEAPRRIKRRWQIWVMVFIILGILALIPLVINWRAFWPWVPFASVVLWIISGIIYGMGRRVTARPLREPRLR